MRKKCWFVFILAAVLIVTAAGGGTAVTEEVLINVVNGRFLCGEYDIELVDVEKPIALGYIHDEAIVQVTTTYGMEEINFGKTQIALTQNAVPYVTELEYDLGDIPDTYEICDVCENSTMIGNHTLMRCGHWGCKMAADHLQVCNHCYGYLCNGKDHSRCDTCKQYWCAHDKYKCSYALNPAPSPFKTTGPDGKETSYLVTPDAIYGIPEELAKPWNPAQDYLDAHGGQQPQSPQQPPAIAP